MGFFIPRLSIYIYTCICVCVIHWHINLINVTTIRQINESLIKPSLDWNSWCLLVGMAYRQVHGICVITGVLRGTSCLYRRFVTQLGMLHCKLDMIMTTTIYFLYQTYLIIGRSLFLLKNTNIMTDSFNLASETVVVQQATVTSSLKKTSLGECR